MELSADRNRTIPRCWSFNRKKMTDQRDKKKRKQFFTWFELDDWDIVKPTEGVPCHPSQTVASCVREAAAGGLKALCPAYPLPREWNLKYKLFPALLKIAWTISTTYKNLYVVYWLNLQRHNYYFLHRLFLFIGSNDFNRKSLVIKWAHCEQVRSDNCEVTV